MKSDSDVVIVSVDSKSINAFLVYVFFDDCDLTTTIHQDNHAVQYFRFRTHSKVTINWSRTQQECVCNGKTAEMMRDDKRIWKVN